MVKAGRLELPISASQMRRLTNSPTPRCPVYVSQAPTGRRGPHHRNGCGGAIRSAGIQPCSSGEPALASSASPEVSNRSGAAHVQCGTRCTCDPPISSPRREDRTHRERVWNPLCSQSAWMGNRSVTWQKCHDSVTFLTQRSTYLRLSRGSPIRHALRGSTRGCPS